MIEDLSQSHIGDISIIQNETYNFKVLIIGEPGVGKTSLKVRYTENKFDPNMVGTTYLDFKKKIVRINQTETAALSIWDTAGSEKFRSIAKSYLNNSQGILLCFDISNRQSFEELNNFWVNFIEEYIEKFENLKEYIISCSNGMISNTSDIKTKGKLILMKQNNLQRPSMENISKFLL